mgnify:CR=1 FL=1
MGYLDLARSRYSCRLFEDRAVEQAVVDAIVEAGRIAPSACNNHPARVMVLDTPELLEKAAACQLGLLVMVHLWRSAHLPHLQRYRRRLGSPL